MSLYRAFMLVFLCFFILSGCSNRRHSALWVCTASDYSTRSWIDYARTRVEAAALVMHRCQSTGSYRSTCVVRCIPPARRWHCVAIDKAGHTWYWNSVNERVAVRNARSACLKSTTVGGCKVPAVNCSLMTS